MIEEFLAVAIVGAILSVVYEKINKKWKGDKLASKMGIIIASIVVGTLYTIIRSTEYYETVLTILGSASTVYALFLKKDVA